MGKNWTEHPLARRPRLLADHSPKGQRTLHGFWTASKTALKFRERAVRHLVRRVRAACPHLTPADMPLIRSWSELEIICSAVFASLMTEGLFQHGNNPKSDLRRVVGEYRKLKLAQLQLANALLLSPAARLAITRGDPSGPVDVVALLANATRVSEDDSNNNNGNNTASADNGADGDAP